MSNGPPISQPGETPLRGFLWAGPEVTGCVPGYSVNTSPLKKEGVSGTVYQTVCTGSQEGRSCEEAERDRNETGQSQWQWWGQEETATGGYLGRGPCLVTGLPVIKNWQLISDNPSDARVQSSFRFVLEDALSEHILLAPSWDHHPMATLRVRSEFPPSSTLPTAPSRHSPEGRQVFAVTCVSPRRLTCWRSQRLISSSPVPSVERTVGAQMHAVSEGQRRPVSTVTWNNWIPGTEVTAAGETGAPGRSPLSSGEKGETVERGP
uniref:Uncharacterized protein n=1 Tax=Rangifer tarandus platyrhynchus TaxID=3082113 RepID=A0ACB0EI42_RANTA|nr:unnamed protein product [Rangifer tarandus platyrhynchus]